MIPASHVVTIMGNTARKVTTADTTGETKVRSTSAITGKVTAMVAAADEATVVVVASAAKGTGSTVITKSGSALRQLPVLYPYRTGIASALAEVLVVF